VHALCMHAHLAFNRMSPPLAVISRHREVGHTSTADRMPAVAAAAAQLPAAEPLPVLTSNIEACATLHGLWLGTTQKAPDKHTSVPTIVHPILSAKPSVTHALAPRGDGASAASNADGPGRRIARLGARLGTSAGRRVSLKRVGGALDPRGLQQHARALAAAALGLDALGALQPREVGLTLSNISARSWAGTHAGACLLLTSCSKIDRCGVGATT
jgi:hypothetical protein